MRVKGIKCTSKMTTIYTHKDGGALAYDPPIKKPFGNEHLVCMLGHTSKYECKNYRLPSGQPPPMFSHFKCLYGHTNERCRRYQNDLLFEKMCRFDDYD